MNKLKRGGCIIAQPNKEDAYYEQVFSGEKPQTPFNWEWYLPKFESQGLTNGCVSFSRLNCAETMAKKEGLELNLSDRHLFVISGTTKSGNNLNAVSEAFRTLGIVREEYFEWKKEMLEDQSAHWIEIFDTSSIPSDARRYLGGNHCWVKSKEAMKSAIAFSPLQLAVPVGETYYDSVIKPPKNAGSYHAIMCYWIDPLGRYHIFDSVSGEKKILSSDYPILQAKSFRDLPLQWKSIEPQIPPSLFSILKNLLTKLAEVLGLISKEIEELPPPPKPEIIDPDVITDKPELEEEKPKYNWDNPVEVRHNIRVICDEYNIPWNQKDLLCDICRCEGQFNPNAKLVNSSKSIDRGLFQINSFWHKEITDEQAYNPEWATRWAIQALKNKKIKTFWSASSMCWNKDGRYNNLV